MDYKQELIILRDAIYELQERHDILLKEFRDSCNHLNVETVKVNHRGGYDYSASSTYTHTCSDCGQHNSETVSHNSGFE